MDLYGFPSDDGAMVVVFERGSRKGWRCWILGGFGKLVMSSRPPSIPVGNHRVPPSLYCSLCGFNVANDNMPSTPTPNTLPVQWIHPLLLIKLIPGHSWNTLISRNSDARAPSAPDVHPTLLPTRLFLPNIYYLHTYLSATSEFTYLWLPCLAISRTLSIFVRLQEQSVYITAFPYPCYSCPTSLSLQLRQLTYHSIQPGLTPKRALPCTYADYSPTPTLTGAHSFCAHASTQSGSTSLQLGNAPGRSFKTIFITAGLGHLGFGVNRVTSSSRSSGCQRTASSRSNESDGSDFR
ncbi:hypothetical protein AB1N83_013680 [Pleurotus pulmonarius]